MRATSIVRNVDQVGRIVLPLGLRQSRGIKENDGLEILVEGNTIVLRKYAPGCSNCGSKEIVAKVGTVNLCSDCTTQIAKYKCQIDASKLEPM